jgi:hypothetical protein
MTQRRRPSLDDAMEKYGTGGSGFFTLKDHGDVAEVRFLHETIDDAWVVAHKVSVGGKERWVECAAEDGDCPLCATKGRPQIKLFLYLVDERDGEVKLWERGKTFVPVMQELVNKYGSLCSQPFEIERDGAAGSDTTKYGIYALERDDLRLDELPERPELTGKDGFVLSLSIEDMERIADGTYRAPAARGEQGGRGERRDSGSRGEFRREERAPSARSSRREEAPRREAAAERPARGRAAAREEAPAAPASTGRRPRSDVF